MATGTGDDTYNDDFLKNVARQHMSNNLYIGIIIFWGTTTWL